MDALLDGQAEALTQRVIELALEGKGDALRMCLDRLCPPRKDRHVTFAMPEIATADDVKAATAAIVRAVSEGALTPSEAHELAAVVELHRKSIDTSDLAARVAALEALQPKRGT